MSHLRWVVLLWVALAGRGVAQGGDGDLLVQARARLTAGDLDSALALLHRITDSATWADSGRRVEALVLTGIAHYYRGDDSGSARAFRAAFTLQPTVEVPGLVGLDSTLVWLFTGARRAILGPPRDTVYSCIPGCRGLDAPPRRLNAPHSGTIMLNLPAPGQEISRLQSGSAEVRAIIDTLGRVEPGSDVVVHSTLPDELLQWILDDLRGAVYEPGRVHGRPVRVEIQIRVR